MAKRSDHIKKIDDIDEKEFLSILDGKPPHTTLPNEVSADAPDEESEAVNEKTPETTVEKTDKPEKTEPEEKESVVKRTYKKRKNSEYLDAFLKPRVLRQRQSVYISQDIHEFISKIVKKLGVRNMTVGVFIDTVMAQHIKDHKEELRAIYYREEGDIFKNIVNNNDDE